ncbi:RRP15-like protein [Lytechinus pictus]|uniref:RRP15-like protein n=1 Tax=Lytechinus pictus TaxID=7653 RepID=UPI0030BA0628
MHDINVHAKIMSALKGIKRKIARVEVSYNSGSDGDIESDEELNTGTGTISKRKMKALPISPPKQQSKEKLNNDSEEDDVENEDEEIPGGGWADAMASILRKETPEDASAVLAKSKDYAKAKEIEKKEFMERVKEKQSRKKWENMAKVMPKVTDKEFERSLQRIATKGVVQLFNAVKKQQKTREERLKEVGGSTRKRAKVEASLTKGNFLDMLKGTPAPSKVDPSSKKKESITSSKNTSVGAEPSWGVLRDDFMLGAGMKDWDKDDDEEEESDDDNRLSSESD